MTSARQLDSPVDQAEPVVVSPGGPADDVESILAQAAARLNEIADESGVAAADAGGQDQGLPVDASSGDHGSPADAAQATAVSLEDIDAQLASLEAILYESSTAAEGLGEATRAAVADAVGAPAEAAEVAPSSETAAEPSGDAAGQVVEAVDDPGLEAALEDLGDLTAIPSLDEKAPAAAPAKPEPLTIRKPREPSQATGGETAGPLTGWRLLMLRLSRPVAAVLAVLDLPFGRLGAGAKSLIGLVAVSTAVVAAATWIIGAFVRPPA